MKYLSIIIIVFFTVSCSEKSKQKKLASVVTCDTFKTGTYKYADTSKAGYIITRKEGLQIEHNRETNDRFVGAIVWLEECKYSLTYIEISNPRLAPLVGVSYTVDMMDLSEDSYTYKSYNKNRTTSGKLIRVEKKQL